MYNYLTAEDDGLPMRESGPWALEKLDYLRRYIHVFETAMRHKWGLRNYIDLLAGPGKNRIRKTDAISLGSPLLALTAEYPFTSYFFADLERENIQALQERCNASACHERVRLYSGDCNILVDEIVAELKRDDWRSLNLAFLDPEGLELQWQTVAKLAGVRRMDLIINYPQGGLNRFMKKAHTSPDETAVDRFFGDSGWRGIYADWQRKRNGSVHWLLLDFYRDRLKAVGYEEVRRDDELGDEPLMRNVSRRAPLYRLLFASKHPLGKKFWHDVTRRDLHGQVRLFE